MSLFNTLIHLISSKISYKLQKYDSRQKYWISIFEHNLFFER